MWETVVQAVINGLLIGGIYALVSIGVTLIFGVVKIVNFAQGEFVMIGMYLSFYLATQFGIDPLVSLVVTMPVLFAAGVLIQHFLIRRVLGPNDMPQIFLTFALSLLLLNLALMLFSANYRTVHTSYSDEAFHLGGLYIPVAKLIAFVVAMILSGALWVFLHTTDLGKAMRAASQNRDVATLMGINPNRVFCVALGIALALAGAAGSLLMPFYSAYPFVGQVFVFMAFVAVVLGTLGNVMGALIASLMMGVAESLGMVDEALEGVEYRESLKPLLEQLPPREKRILLLRFFGNMTQSQIATELGISQMHVSRLLARTLAQLREGLTSDE